jgi:hypothetical protein
MKSHKKIRILITAVLLVALGVTGVLCIIYNTRFGPILMGDSIVYIQGALNLLDGNGYSTLLGRGEVESIKGFPPMTSISLAIASLGRADMVQTGRWLNAILFGLNIIITGFFVFRYSRSVLSAIIAAMMLTTQQALVVVHSSVMSEGLFIFFLLLALWTAMEYFWSGKAKWLVISGALTAACFLTRYIGLVLVPVIGAGLLFFGKKDWKKRAISLLIFGAISMIPMIIWFVRNQIISGSAIDRQIGLHLMSQDMRGLLFDNVLSWFYITNLGLPWKMEFLLFSTLLSGFFFWFGFSVLKSKEKGGERNYSGYQLPLLLAMLFIFYIATIWINTSMLDASTSMGAIGRYLSPLFVCLVIMVASLASNIVQQQRRLFGKVFFCALGFMLVGYYSSSLIPYLQIENHGVGHGYTDNINYWTEDIAVLSQLNPDRPIITNDTQLLYALTNRYSYRLPFMNSPAPGGSSVDENKLLSELSRNAYLVIIVRGDEVVADVLPEEILEKLVLYKHSMFVWVYILPESAP